MTDPLDAALIDAAANIDPRHDITDELTDYLRGVIGDGAGIREANMWVGFALRFAAVAFPAGLARRLTYLGDAAWARNNDQPIQHEDLPCTFWTDPEGCPTCHGIRADQLTDALDQLKNLLGDTVCADLRKQAS